MFVTESTHGHFTMLRVCVCNSKLRVSVFKMIRTSEWEPIYTDHKLWMPKAIQKNVKQKAASHTGLLHMDRFPWHCLNLNNIQVGITSKHAHILIPISNTNIQWDHNVNHPETWITPKRESPGTAKLKLCVSFSRSTKKHDTTRNQS